MPYKPKGEVFCNDGREMELLRFIQNHPEYSSMKNSPEAVLAAIDEFGTTKKFLMNLGQEKGELLTPIIATQQPRFLIEIGSYVGYSAILFGNEFRKRGGERYLSLELNHTFALVARELVALAGLDETVEIIDGPCRESLRDIRDHGIWACGMIFIDHDKDLYLNDLKLCEGLGLVGPSTTVIADNMIQPGNPAYSAYVRESPESKKKRFEEDKAKKGEDEVSLGNPDLAYETMLVNGSEPTGADDAMEISWCKDQNS